MKWLGTFGITWLMAVICSVLFCSIPGRAAAGESRFDRYLDRHQTTDIPALLRRYREADSHDDREAVKALDYGRKSISRNRWDAAFKSYGLSALIKPSVTALLGMSQAYVRVRRPRDSCDEELSAKHYDLANAREYFEAAVAFHKALGKNSDVTQQTIEQYRRKLNQATERVLKYERKCMARSKRWPDRQPKRVTGDPSLTQQ